MSDLAPTAQAMCRYIVTNIVDDTDAVSIEAAETDDNFVRLNVRVAKPEMGRVIGKRGRTANAIRTLVRAAGSRDDRDIQVEFLD